MDPPGLSFSGCLTLNCIVSIFLTTHVRYGIATPKGSKWRDPISLAILELQEKGTIQMLYNKWWKNTGDVCTRQVTDRRQTDRYSATANTPFVLLMGLSSGILNVCDRLFGPVFTDSENNPSSNIYSVIFMFPPARPSFKSMTDGCLMIHDG